MLSQESVSFVWEVNGMENNTNYSKRIFDRVKQALLVSSAQSWPLLMVVIIGFSLIPIIVSEMSLKMVGVIFLWYAARELRRWWAARKAGQMYCPARAIIGYIIFIVICVVLVIGILAYSVGPVQKVKDVEFDAYPGITVGEIMSRTMVNPDWSHEDNYVYVYGNVDGKLMGFEFNVDTRGDYYYVTLTDAYYEGIWWGQVMADAYFSGLASSCT